VAATVRRGAATGTAACVRSSPHQRGGHRVRRRGGGGVDVSRVWALFGWRPRRPPPRRRRGASARGTRAQGRRVSPSGGARGGAGTPPTSAPPPPPCRGGAPPPRGVGCARGVRRGWQDGRDTAVAAAGARGVWRAGTGAAAGGQRGPSRCREYVGALPKRERKSASQRPAHAGVGAEPRRSRHGHQSRGQRAAATERGDGDPNGGPHQPPTTTAQGRHEIPVKARGSMTLRCVDGTHQWVRGAGCRSWPPAPARAAKKRGRRDVSPVGKQARPAVQPLGHSDGPPRPGAHSPHHVGIGTARRLGAHPTDTPTPAAVGAADARPRSAGR